MEGKKTVLKGLLLSKERDCYKDIDKQQETEKSQYGQEQYNRMIKPTSNENNLPARQNRFSRFFNQIRSRFSRQNYNENQNRSNPFNRKKQEETQYSKTTETAEQQKQASTQEMQQGDYTQIQQGQIPQQIPQQPMQDFGGMEL